MECLNSRFRHSFSWEACYPVRVKLFARVLLCVLLAAILVVVLNYETIPSSSITASHFDTLIVLGNPARDDGSPGPEQRERVLEAVREYRAGVASAVIMTGGAAHNQYVEAHVMAQYAFALGVPTSALFEETQAQNTIQNVFYSAELMQQHGWHSAEVISSPSHLPRAGLILQTFDRVQPALAISWRTHAASWPPEYPFSRRMLLISAEALYCLRLRVNGFPRSRFLPAPR